MVDYLLFNIDHTKLKIPDSVIWSVLMIHYKMLTLSLTCVCACRLRIAALLAALLSDPGILKHQV